MARRNIIIFTTVENGETHSFTFTEEEFKWLEASGISMDAWCNMASHFFGWEAMCKYWM